MVNGDELYTKKEVSDYFPFLNKFLQRKAGNWDELGNELLKFCDVILEKFPIKDDKSNNTVTFLLNGKEITYDLKLERKV